MTVPVSNMTATFANTTIRYDAIGMDVNASAYAANSTLINLKTNGVSKFFVEPNGHITAGNGTVGYPNTPYFGIATLGLKGTLTDYRFAIQDGTGRVNTYWNAFRESSAATHRYIVSNEPAARIYTHVAGTSGPASGAIYSWYSAPGANSGEAITWTTIATMVGGNNGYTWFSPRGTSSDFYIANTGNVGIGTENPQYKLDVNGSINVSSFIVNTANITTANIGTISLANQPILQGSFKSNNVPAVDYTPNAVVSFSRGISTYYIDTNTAIVVPTNGIYQAHAQQLVTSGNQPVYLHIRKNGTTISYAYMPAATSTRDLIVSSLIECVSGDIIDFYYQGNTTSTFETPHSSFYIRMIA